MQNGGKTDGGKTDVKNDRQELNTDGGFLKINGSSGAMQNTPARKPVTFRGTLRIASPAERASLITPAVAGERVAPREATKQSVFAAAPVKDVIPNSHVILSEAKNLPAAVPAQAVPAAASVVAGERVAPRKAAKQPIPVAVSAQKPKQQKPEPQKSVSKNAPVVELVELITPTESLAELCSGLLDE